MPVELPNGNSPEDQIVNIGVTATLAAFLFASTACVGTDSSTAPDVTHLTSAATSRPNGSDPSAAPRTAEPSVPSSSTGPGLSGLAVLSDDFTKYSSITDLLANITSAGGGTGDRRTVLYSDGGTGGGLVELDKTVLYNGHATMKYNQPGGTAASPELFAYLPNNESLTHIWYRVKVRFSSGFTTTGTLVNSANAYKLISWGWNGDKYNGSGRIEISNTDQYMLYENMQQGGTLAGGGQYLMAGRISTEWTDGGWYDYIVEVDHSQPTGVIRLWRAKDGQPPVYQGQAIEKMNDGSPVPALTYISVGLNFNQVRAPNQNQAVWWGEWEVVDGTQHPNPFGVSH